MRVAQNGSGTGNVGGLDFTSSNAESIARMVLFAFIGCGNVESPLPSRKGDGELRAKPMNSAA